MVKGRWEIGCRSAERRQAAYSQRVFDGFRVPTRRVICGVISMATRGHEGKDGGCFRSEITGLMTTRR